MEDFGQMNIVPDLYCSEILPDFEGSGFDNLYSDPTSTKDSSNGEISHSKGVGRGNPCTDCYSMFCNHDQSFEAYTSLLPSIDPNHQPQPQGDYLANLSYHDIWCDDNVSWKFDSGSENQGYDADESDASSLTTWPDSAVPQIDENPEDQHDLQVQETDQDVNLPQGDLAPMRNVHGEVHDMSDEDIFAFDESLRSVPGPGDMVDILDTDWWELSQLSSLSQTSQSSSVDDAEEDAQTVPTLRSALRQHRNAADDMDTGDMSEGRERRQQLLFSASCASVEQVVPTWPSEE